MFILTLINTVILIILFGAQVKQIIKERILDKTDLDEKIVAKIKEFVSSIKK